MTSRYVVTFENDKEAYLVFVPSQSIGDGPEIGIWTGKEAYKMSCKLANKYIVQDSMFSYGDWDLHKVKTLRVTKEPLPITTLDYTNTQFGEDGLD